MQRLDAVTMEVPEQNQSGVFPTQLLLHLRQSSCITASFSSAAGGGLGPVQIAATKSGVAGSSLTFAATAFSGSPASSSASWLSALKSLPETWVKLSTTDTLALGIFCTDIPTPPPTPGAQVLLGWQLHPCAYFTLPPSPPRESKGGSSSPSVMGQTRHQRHAARWLQAGVSPSVGRCRASRDGDQRGCSPRPRAPQALYTGTGVPHIICGCTVSRP